MKFPSKVAVNSEKNEGACKDARYQKFSEGFGMRIQKPHQTRVR